MKFRINEDTVPEVEKVLSYGSCFKLLDLVYPWGYHLAAVKNSKDIVIIQSSSGEEVGEVRLDVIGEIVNIISHWDYPIVAVSTSAGELCLVSVNVFRCPRVLRKYRLNKNSMEIVKFSQCGRYVFIRSD